MNKKSFCCETLSMLYLIYAKKNSNEEWFCCEIFIYSNLKINFEFGSILLLKREVLLNFFTIIHQVYISFVAWKNHEFKIWIDRFFILYPWAAFISIRPHYLPSLPIIFWQNKLIHRQKCIFTKSKLYSNPFLLLCQFLKKKVVIISTTKTYNSNP